MQTIEQAYQEVCRLHEQIAKTPVPEIGPPAFLPFPPGVDPVAFAIEEVAQLKRMFEGAAPATAWVPRASLHASDSSLVYHVEIPGVPRETVSVVVNGAEMIVRGQRTAPTLDAGLKPMFVEQPWGAFERRFPCPPWCDPEKIHAKVVHGVLEIHLGRREEGNRGEFRVDIA
jgi:HSP20 family molecular chaperone IbpA